jgi:hypothetical protein
LFGVSAHDDDECTNGRVRAKIVSAKKALSDTEKQLYEAMLKVEQIPASTQQTNAIIALSEIVENIKKSNQRLGQS